MPIPTADSYDRATESKNKVNSDQTPLASEANPSDQVPGSVTSGTAAVSGASSSQNGQGGRSMSREEADRLYEERMEEEYAKREGGA